MDKLCPVEPLCQLLDEIRKTDVETFKKVRVVQVGNINDPLFYETLEKYNLTEMFEINNQKGRIKTIELLNKTSMMYLGLNQKYEDGIVTTRIFDMIASGRSILAAVSEHSEIFRLFRLLQDVPDSCCFSQASISTAKDFLLQEILGFNDGSKKINPIPSSILPYSSNMMAEQFAVLIKEIVSNNTR